MIIIIATGLYSDELASERESRFNTDTNYKIIRNWNQQ